MKRLRDKLVEAESKEGLTPAVLEMRCELDEAIDAIDCGDIVTQEERRRIVSLTLAVCNDDLAGQLRHSNWAVLKNYLKSAKTWFIAILTPVVLLILGAIIEKVVDAF